MTDKKEITHEEWNELKTKVDDNKKEIEYLKNTVKKHSSALDALSDLKITIPIIITEALQPFSDKIEKLQIDIKESELKNYKKSYDNYAKFILAAFAALTAWFLSNFFRP